MKKSRSRSNNVLTPRERWYNQWWAVRRMRMGCDDLKIFTNPPVMLRRAIECRINRELARLKAGELTPHQLRVRRWQWSQKRKVEGK